MKHAPIVKSLLETDLYKLTMLQCLLHSHPAASAEYAFKCRNTPQIPLTSLKTEVEAELDHLCAMQYSEDELAYLGGLRYLKSDFIDFLRLFKFQRKFIKVETQGDELLISTKGPLIHTMLFEIFVLYIVNELYFRAVAADNMENTLAEARRRLRAKIELLQREGPTLKGINSFEFFDFGLRRRFSAQWHEEVVATLAQEVPEYFKGTSNVHYAKKFGLVPIGTMAHEYLQSFQAFGVRLRDFQKAALEGWVQEYRGDLGVALTDVVGMDAFLADFDLYFAKLFEGLRHDSGCPFEWGEKALAHYKKLRVDAHSKRLVFSDGLTIERAFELHRHFSARVMTGYGIGTNLSNDVGITPLNIVMKLVRCNDEPVAKLSDSSGKTMCKDETFLAYLRQVFNHAQ